MSFDRVAIERLRDECLGSMGGCLIEYGVGLDQCLGEIAVLEDSGVKAVKCLDSACTHYCEWYATGRASDAGHVAYDLVSRIREALHILRLAETGGR